MSACCQLVSCYEFWQRILLDHISDNCTNCKAIAFVGLVGKDWTPFKAFYFLQTPFRSSRTEVFLGKSALKICSKFTGEHPCRRVISIKLLCNFIEITLRHGCSPVNLLHTSRITLLKNTSGLLLLSFEN